MHRPTKIKGTQIPDPLEWNIPDDNLYQWHWVENKITNHLWEPKSITCQWPYPMMLTFAGDPKPLSHCMKILRCSGLVIFSSVWTDFPRSNDCKWPGGKLVARLACNVRGVLHRLTKLHNNDGQSYKMQNEDAHRVPAHLYVSWWHHHRNNIENRHTARFICTQCSFAVLEDPQYIWPGRL